MVETNAGVKSCFDDSSYISSGAIIKEQASAILRQSDILLKVTPPTITEIKNVKNSALIIANFQNSSSAELLDTIRKKTLTCFALEKLPRISKTQSFDILSSQENLSGYQSIIKAAELLKKSVPMMITSAGTLPPIKFLILGVGIAGLQAIATAKRLGAKVYAHDIRDETKEQVQSLGAIFIQNINEIISDVDVVIASAFSQNKKAPVIIKKTTIKDMKKGALLIDMAISQGGNIEGSKNLKNINIYNCQIYANSNLANLVPQSASTLYSNNLSNFIEYLGLKAKTKPILNISDDVIKAVLL